MDVKLSTKAISILLAFTLIGAMLGAGSLIVFDIFSCSDADIESNQKQHDQLIQDITREKKELERLRLLISQDSTSQYEVQLSFIADVIDPQNIKASGNEINLSVVIPTSKEFYYNTIDDTIIKKQTKAYGDPVEALNVTKVQIKKVQQ